jgi:hypothetical protein
MNNKQQTAVDWIEQEMLKGNLSLKEILIQAKEIEKEQIIDACWAGGDDGEQYYEQTYGDNK